MAHSSTIIVIAFLSVSYLYNLGSSDSSDDVNPSAFNCPHTVNASISYKNSINLLLSDFVNQSSVRDYYITSTGNSPDIVFGFYMCRRDLKREACQNCISNAREFSRLFADCEYQDGTFLSPKCIFRYTSHSIYGMWHQNLFKVSYLGEKLSNFLQYNQTLSPTIEGLINEAAFNGSLTGFATKEANFTEGKKIYSLAQCTPDIVGVNCSRCLEKALSVLWSDKENEGYQGGEVDTANCLLRYDNQSFYDLQVVKMKPNESVLRPPDSGEENPSDNDSTQPDPNKIDRLRPPSAVAVYSALIMFMFCTCTLS